MNKVIIDVIAETITVVDIVDDVEVTRQEIVYAPSQPIPNGAISFEIKNNQYIVTVADLQVTKRQLGLALLDIQVMVGENRLTLDLINSIVANSTDPRIKIEWNESVNIDAYNPSFKAMYTQMGLTEQAVLGLFQYAKGL